jgi:serine/threonine-protein phosphatase Stp1
MPVKTSADGRFRSSACTHVGAVRNHNEDRFVDRPDLGLWAVADGAGGHQAGEVASGKIAELLEAIPAHLDAQQVLTEVRQRLADAHQMLQQEAARRGSGAVIASTVVVLLARDAHFACLWAGDSRAYLLRGGQFAQVTRDHSLVQELVDSGVITAEQALTHPQGNVITRAIGSDSETLDLDKVTGQLLPGDRFLLCSDGLSKTLPESDIATILRDHRGTPVPERLIEVALAHRVTDNVTAVAVDVAGRDAG